jgi:hypothetical protein
MKNYETVSEAVTDLSNRGYTLNFNLREDTCIECREPSIFLRPEEFEIDEVYRFEGITDPGDSSIVLAISSHDHAAKGTLVSAYGMYAEPGMADLLTRLPFH